MDRPTDRLKLLRRPALASFTSLPAATATHTLLASRRHTGSIIVMGDADDSYDFTAIQDLVAPIVEQGHDYVHGSRLSGQIERGQCRGRTATSATRC